jgi:hypothetical protein
VWQPKAPGMLRPKFAKRRRCKDTFLLARLPRGVGFGRCPFFPCMGCIDAGSEFNIEVHGGAITVMSSDPKFCATYYKPSDKPHLCLRIALTQKTRSC